MPTKRPATKRPSRATRTKADLENELETLKAAQEDGDTFTPEAESLVREHAAKTREAVKGLSVDSIVAAGAQFGLQAQRTVASLTEEIANKANELKTLQDAIDIETRELQRLYDLDVAAASVKALIQEHEEKKATLEKEIAQVRGAWIEESRNHDKFIQQRNQEIDQTRRREQDEYAYKTRQDRQRQEDEFQQKQIKEERALAERISLSEREIADKRAQFAKEADEIAAMKERLNGIDTEIKAKVDRDVAIATNSLKKDLTNTFNLEKKDLELQIRILGEQKTGADAAAARLAQQVETLTKQLDAARDQVRAISEKALESAAGQVALNAVRETVKDIPNGGRSGKA